MTKGRTAIPLSYSAVVISVNQELSGDSCSTAPAAEVFDVRTQQSTGGTVHGWSTPDLCGSVLAGRINLAPTPFPVEFRADVVAVACKGEAPLRPIAKDFGISEAYLHRWLKIADREDGRG